MGFTFLSRLVDENGQLGLNASAFERLSQAKLEEMQIQMVRISSCKIQKDGTLASFNKNYVKTEIFPKTFGRKIAVAEEIRHASDYDDFYIATKEQAEEQITTAKELIGLIDTYCLNRIMG